MAQRSIPAPFLMKTFQLVDDPASDDVISWNESGTAFVVWKTVDFARDMLPNYFKHNNFSSFVRQLNTYGFRKTVPDKWEFANDNFRRGEKELLSEIRRRKAVTSSPANQANAAADQKSNGDDTTGSNNSGEDIASTSTSTSPDSKNPGSVDTAAAADLSDENEKLKKNNESLSSELAQTKKQCDELVAFLMEYMKVGPDQISNIMRQGRIIESRCDGGGDRDHGHEINNDNDDKVVAGKEEEEGLKLFGVWVKGKENEEDVKKGDGGKPQAKKRKVTEFHHAPPFRKSGKVCN